MDAKAEKGKVSNHHIPNDLTLSILSKLSLKSLKRFGCCCKSWGFLFESPHFMSMYRNNVISNNHTSCYDEPSVIILHHFPPLPITDEFMFSVFLFSGERHENKVKLYWPPLFLETDYIQMLSSDSINGNILVQRQRMMIFWNPSTNEFKVIPPSPVESGRSFRDPMIRFHGFGYDHVRDDYKVIRRVHFYELISSDLDPLNVSWEDVSWGDVSIPPLWEIYSLKRNSWRKLDVDMPECYHENTGFHVYTDGMCHWRGESVGPEECLVSFDLINEAFIITPMPSDIDEIRAFISSTNDEFDFKMDRHLVLLNGSIALISYYIETTFFHISILGELGVQKSWTKLFIIGPLPYVYTPIGVGKKGDIFLRQEDNELVWYNLNTNVIEKLGITGMNDCCRTGIYRENLLLLE
ncbi:hypothetical protein VNO78_21485 [Psophocarpus tetragonolobus]|uniref:F-box protein interaction domain protein n=1 Tax=Psophocarpus tetragonolobus TaxID=3891 RepID=A0AAN9SB93_PSOTE